MAHHALLQRIRAEFLEMPGMRLKPGQVQRLCGIEGTACQLVLDLLVDEQFLCVKSDGHYARLMDGAISRPHPAKADLRPEQRSVRAV
jgi:hypothetical protein